MYLCPFFLQLSIGTVPVANLGDEIHSASNETMSLNLDVLADIFAGVITNWNDSRIIDSLLNGGSPTMATMLPNATINVREREFEKLKFRSE